MLRRPPRSTRTDTPFPTRRSSDLAPAEIVVVDDLDDGSTAAIVQVTALRTEIPLRRILNRTNPGASGRSEEHTSELQSLMRISYAVFCLKKKHTRPCSIHTYIRPTTASLQQPYILHLLFLN